MGEKARRNQHTGVNFIIAAGDVAKDLIATPGPNSEIVVTVFHFTLKTTVAQSAEFQSTDGTVKLASIGVSQVLGLAADYAGEIGVGLGKNQALRYVTSAAGFVGDGAVEYYIRRYGDLSAI